MKNQHDSTFESEFIMNDFETPDQRGVKDLEKNPGLEIDGLIVNNQLYEFQQAVDGKVMFTLVENTEVRTQAQPTKKQNDRLSETKNDLPVDESIRPGPRPQRRDNQLSQKELERRNRRRAINRDCARRARQRRQINESDLETRILHLEQENASWMRKYSDLEEKYERLSALRPSSSSQCMDLLK